MFDSKDRHIGPHVLEPTTETKGLSENGEWKGLKKVWKCKYCDWEGIHPDDCSVSIGIKRDCDEFEWLDSELEAFEQ